MERKLNCHSALEEVDPANLDHKLIRELFERFGDSLLAARLGRSAIFDGLGAIATGNVKDLDDFSACGIEHPEDIRELFTRNFYFGCEADDPINAWAFNTRVNPYRARIRTLLGSDIGHFDVVNMNEVLKEAYELVDDGLITEMDFREFVFINPVRSGPMVTLISSKARLSKMKLLRSFATYSHRRGSYLFVLGLAKLLVVSPVLREQFRAGLQAAEHSYLAGRS